MLSNLLRYAWIISILALASAGAASPPSVKQTGSMDLDVEFDGRRYVAVASYWRFSDGHDDSCVILIPSWERPSIASTAGYGRNSVSLSGHQFQFVGRRVGIATESGDRLTLLSGELPPQAFRERDSLERALLKLLKKHGRAKKV